MIWPEQVTPASDLALLASAACDPDEPLGSAVERFALTISDARSVANAWPLIAEENAGSLLQHFESNPDLTPFQLAEALFAPADGDGHLWEVPEAQRVKALLGAHNPSYIRMLDSSRLESAWRSDRTAMLNFLDHRDALSGDAANLLLASAIREVSPDEIVERLEDRELMELALVQRDDLLREPRLWSALERSRDRELRDSALAVAGPDVSLDLAEAQCWSLLDQALDRATAFPYIAEHLAQARPTAVPSWRKVMGGHEHQLTSLLSKTCMVRPEVSILAAATLPRRLLNSVPLRRWLDAAPAMHKRADQASAVAAARLVAITYRRKEPAARELLIECFGPAHKAVEGRNLPSEVIAELEDSLPNPKTKSLAKRLSRALIASMESSRWTETELRRALECAGPEARKLVKLVPKKNPLRRRIEGALHDLEDLLPLP
ncbi:MAG TPA: hypothetical protein VLK89_00070 [Solirubrobacterales bacterium]|nr:hypothetical protein [Solirubrobacterales bacterium]